MAFERMFKALSNVKDRVVNIIGGKKAGNKFPKIVDVKGNYTGSVFEATGQFVKANGKKQDLKITDFGTSFDMEIGKNKASGFAYFAAIKKPKMVKALAGVKSVERHASCDARANLLVGGFVDQAKKMQAQR